MPALEILFWLLLGTAIASVQLTSMPRPSVSRWWRSVLRCAIASLTGGLIGVLLMRPNATLGELNVASIVFAGAAAAVTLLTETAVRDHRAMRHRRRHA